jgi:hypothetical protein
MGKGTHFSGQPVYGQLIKSLDRAKIIEMSRKNNGARYVKSFDGYTHLLTCDVQFTSAATNDSFMLAPNHYQHDEILAMDRAYINYEKFEELTDRNVVYVTKMKKNCNSRIISIFVPYFI